MAFLDIKAAHDTVPRELLWKKVANQEKNNKEKWEPLLRDLFDINETRFITPLGLTEKIYFYRGLAQGSKLSPILFNIFINDIPSEIQTIQNQHVTQTLFNADDILIVPKTGRSLQSAINKAVKFSTRNGIELNVKKCKIVGKDNR